MATAMTDEEQNLNDSDTDFIPCPKHPEEPVIFVCANCAEEWACALCVTTCHDGHCLDSFKDYVEQKRQSLRQKMHEVEHNTLPSLKEQIDLLNVELEKNASRTENTKEAILNRSEELKAELDKISRKFTRVCRQTESENDSKLEIHKEHLENIYHEYMQEMAKFEQQLLEDNNDEVDESQIPKVREQPSFPTTTTTTFEPGVATEDQMAALFGDLKIIKTRIGDTANINDDDIDEKEDTENGDCSDQQKENLTTDVLCAELEEDISVEDPRLQ